MEKSATFIKKNFTRIEKYLMFSIIIIINDEGPFFSNLLGDVNDGTYNMCLELVSMRN